MNKKISIIIPAYNSEHYIKEALDSVYLQTYQNFEVIVVNDGSVDKTLSIIESYKKNVNNMSVINIENHGQGYARNLAVKKAKGDYILFFDSDDILNPLLLETALEKIQKDNSDFVFFNWTRYNDTTKKEMKSKIKKFIDKKILVNDECLEMLSLRPYYTVVCLYKKDFLIKNNLKYGEKYYYEDIIFWLKVVASSKKVSILKDSLYRVRYNDKSVTSTEYDSKKHFTSFINMLNDSNEYLNHLEKRDYNEFYNYIINRFFLYYNERTSKKYKDEFIKLFLQCINDSSIDINNNTYDEDLINVYNIAKENKNVELLKKYNEERTLKKSKEKELNNKKNKKTNTNKLLDSCKTKKLSDYSKYFKNNKKENIIVYFSKYNNLLKNINFIKNIDNKHNYYLLIDEDIINNNNSLVEYSKGKVTLIPYTLSFQKNIVDILKTKINNNKKDDHIKRIFEKEFKNVKVNKIVLDDSKYERKFKYLSNNIEILKFNDVGNVIKK